jgi:hypothetical protein
MAPEMCNALADGKTPNGQKVVKRERRGKMRMLDLKRREQREIASRNEKQRRRNPGSNI